MTSNGSCAGVLDYDGFAVRVKGLGPGTRVALWVRGCGIGCTGCMTKELWAKGEPRPISDLARQMLPALQVSDGLTISGGEPFDQSESLSSLIDLLRKSLPLHVLCYSGYPIERLRKDPASNELLGRLDMLIDGPYAEHLPTERKWRGSDNQRLHCLQGEVDGDDESGWRQLQLQPLSDGSVRLIGIPQRGDIHRLKDSLLLKGLRLRSEI